MTFIKSLPKPLIALALLFLLGIVWGTGYSIARFAMTHDVPPLGYSFWQSLGPAIILSLLSLRFGTSQQHTTTTPVVFYLVAGMTGIVIPNTTMYYAAQHLPAGILALIVNTVPIIAYPLAIMTKLEHFCWQRMLGIILATCGLLCIILPKTSLPDPQMVPWVITTLITPISFAICSIYIARNRPPRADSIKLAAGMLVCSSLLLLPFVLLKQSFYLFHYPLTMPDQIILLEILLSSFGYVLYFKLLRIAGPVYYSLVDTVVVLTGLFWGYALFHEKLNQWTATAVTLIILALILVTRQQRNATGHEKIKSNT